MTVLSKKEIIIIFLGALLSALSCFYSSSGGGGNISTPMSMFISFMYVVLAFSLPLEQTLMLVALAFPNTKALGFGGISCSIIVCALAVIRNIGKTNKVSSIAFISFIYVIYCTQFIGRFDDYRIGLIMPLKTVVNLLFFSILASYLKISSNSFNIGFKTVIALFAGIVSAFWISLNQANADATRIGVEGNDPNMLAVECAFTASYLCVYYYNNKAFSKWFFLIAITILSAITLFSGSRTGLTLMGFVVTFSIIYNVRQFKRSILLTVIFGGALVAFLMSSTGMAIIEALILRNENLVSHGDISNNRFELWSLYITVFNSDPILWFLGLGDYHVYRIPQPAHNFLIEDIAAYGIIGVAILYMTYRSIFVRQYKNAKRFHTFKPNLFTLIPFFIPIIGGITLHGLTSIMNTMMLYLGVLCMTMPKSPSKI